MSALPDRRVLELRRVDYYLDLFGRDPDDWSDIERVHRQGQLLPAWDAALTDERTAVSFTLALRRYCMTHVLWSDYLERGLRIPASHRACVPAADDVRLLLSLGQAAHALHRFDEAAAFARQVLDHPYQDDADLRAFAWHGLGVARSATDDWEDAVACYEQALALWRGPAADREGHTATLVNLARAVARDGRTPQALALLDEARAVLGDLDRPEVEASLVNCRGQLLEDTGQYAQAAECYQHALQVWRRTSDRRSQAAALSNLALVRAHQGEHGEALRLLREVLGIEEQLPDLDLTATLSNLATVHLSRGEASMAIAYYERVAALEENASATDRATTFNNIGLALADVGEHTRALAMYDRALPLWQRVRHRRGICITLSNRAVSRIAQNDAAAAMRDLLRADRIARAISEVAQQGIIRNNMGLALSTTAQPRRALAYYSEAESLHAATGDRSEQVTTLVNTARLHHQLADDTRACAVLRRAVEIGRTMDHPDLPDHVALLAELSG
ncbi:tetratricopeptide (TPR) repeat protein [Streptomyces sp. SAI-208]|uniref:tetratricopeptide repeat protein n=1 Tax=Streptomyces sp. SAI-208 TaxID=2940550 RepID=UPI002474E701|nr:tetratricopeptide repeat protein [Streptomyces sp. SAI-208]MDH6604447.1 tetratricopeptide (TPR) repeat protein [Streptomyces sp. SAI-208]